MVIQTRLKKMVACAFHGYNQPFLSWITKSLPSDTTESHIFGQDVHFTKKTDISANMRVVFAT